MRAKAIVDLIKLDFYKEIQENYYRFDRITSHVNSLETVHGYA